MADRRREKGDMAMTSFNRMLATTAAAALLAGTALAQEQTAQSGVGETGLEEIVVTAQRRAQNVQDVPIAVSAFTANELENRGVTETLDLIQYVPNLFGSNNTGLGSANAYYIRGLGNTETIATFDPPVGTYIDDVYISRQNANNFSFFDIERLEVLRGPQGTLFGRNTTGGAVNVILAKPGDELGGFAEAGYGRFDKKMVRGSIDLPLNEKLSLKLSGYWQSDDGYAKNTTTGQRLNDNDGSGVRAAARLKVTDNITWDVAYARMNSDGENILNFDCDPAAPTSCKGRFITTGLTETKPAPGVSLYAPLVITGRKAGYALGNEAQTDLVTSNIQIEGEDHTLSLITGYVDVVQQFALDFFDGRGGPNLATPNPVVRRFPRGGFTILNDGKHEQFTQEVKLNGKLFGGFLDYVAGAYFYDEDNTTDFADVFTIFTGAPGGTPLLLADRTLSNGTKATAGYVQVDANVTDQLKLTAGVRYTDEEKTFSIRDNRAICAATPLPATCLSNANLRAANGVAIPTVQTTKLWTPRVAVDFKPNDDTLLFASATRGFKSGGWNARATTPSQFLPFDPEKVWSYETGVKTQLLDDRLRVNLTGFYMDVSDLQTPSALVNPATGAITFITQNFADYENKGLEIEITAVPTSGLNLYANAGFQDDKYKVSDTLLPNAFGITSVRAQQAQCRAQLAANQVPLGPSTAVAPAAPNNAPACGAGIIDSQGNIATPVRTPKLSLAFGGSYDYELGQSGAILSPSVNVSYRSSLETGTANATIYSGAITGVNGAFTANPNSGAFLNGSEAKAYWLLNAGLALRTDDGNWLLSVECENCLGEVHNQSSLSNYTYLSPPGTWMVRARRKF
jgi:iron complex outermembrane receptor protein